MSTQPPPPKDRGWRGDFFATREVLGHYSSWVMPVVAALIAAGFLPVLNCVMTKGQDKVVAYCAQDQAYAEPIFREFTRQTGIKVRAVHDSEAVKTVGLANRLLAERSHPQCDIFWGNEELRTRQLAARGVFRETNAWAAIGYRSRRIVINTNRLSLAAAPRSLLELTNETWRGKVALAYPQFGTTATHFHTLRQHWGDERWQAWCRALVANQPLLVDGNSVVVRMVGRGEAWIGLTDSDDVVAVGHKDGLPVAQLPMSGETLLIPNTIGLVRGGPNPKAAQRLFEYLQRPEVARQLVAAHALEGVSIREITTPRLEPDWEALLRDLEDTTAKLNRIFLR
ncbi:MAG TPA: substrate-binding domain-containing protein [Candidatus Paceibacterota bacterium]|nr:substrate-binding domain-containing protein [Verrucomicrobiota bacterium]HSA08891.1 substrate-binding domain-containing protein [Candidatus Paceibacterota bacterium]